MQNDLHIVYLDQNVLSDLRDRKLREANDEILNSLKKLLLSEKYRLAYSFVNLHEILQIRNQDYQTEHIDLLNSFAALYIRPVDGRLLSVDPYKNWFEYNENEKSNQMLGIDHANFSLELFSRKLSGLNIDDSFETLTEQLSSAVANLMGNALKQVEKIDSSDLSEDERNYLEQAKEKIFDLKNQANNMESFHIEPTTELGPEPFREVVRIKNLDQLPSAKVIPRILNEFEKLSKTIFSWPNIGEDPVGGKIAGCYTLMNWVGYFSDDFTSDKKNKDRFRASKWDMMHTSNARFCDSLVSNDNRLLKKAIACYSYLNLKTKVYTVSEFLKEHSTKDKL